MALTKNFSTSTRTMPSYHNVQTLFAICASTFVTRSASQTQVLLTHTTRKISGVLIMQ